MVTGYGVNGSMRVLGTCGVGSSPAILMSGVGFDRRSAKLGTTIQITGARLYQLTKVLVY